MITSISPLDGRYESKVKSLQKYFSEYALIRYRLRIEIEWLIHLSNHLPDLKALSKEKQLQLRLIYQDFSSEQADEVKSIEATTNHDVKAVEYFLRQQIEADPKLILYSEFIHFACTSEDINNLAYALMLKDGFNDDIFFKMDMLIDKLLKIANDYKSLPMLARTHGQTASPTTLGKEIINVAYRFQRKVNRLREQEALGKMNGAVGNFNAHLSAYPSLDWIEISRSFVADTLSLKYNLLTTQIEPHDFIAEVCHTTQEFNTILIDFNRDIWSYISIGYFKQKTKKGEIGSSTMPHKVNPIDFENSEGNLGIANSILNHLAEKLPISRWQRDLSDSTVLRNIGIGFAYSVLAIDSTMKGLSKLEVNKKQIEADINDKWEVLAEPIQTVMRRHKIENAYEKLKELTRGKEINKDSIHSFIKTLKIPADDKKRLLALTPKKYIGLAEQLVDKASAELF